MYEIITLKSNAVDFHLPSLEIIANEQGPGRSDQSKNSASIEKTPF